MPNIYYIWFVLFYISTQVDTLFETHRSLLTTSPGTVPRELQNEIDWNQRIIGVKGVRGVGKTTFLIDHIRTHYPHDRSCLYINLNNFYFTKRKLFSFADEFYKRGGKILVIDQMNKYPNWSQALFDIYKQIPELKIIFASSPVLRVLDGNDDLKDLVKIYHLQGLSFREYLNFRTGNDFPSFALEDILSNHHEIVPSILSKIRPFAYFSDYLKHGYYPFFPENDAIYTEALLKHVNLALEIDVTYNNQIELQYLPRLRKLIQLISDQVPFSPNVSRLSSDIGTSRATVMNYLRYLKNARLVDLLYSTDDEKEAKKPTKVFLQNTNLLHTISPENTSTKNLITTFFLNQLQYRNSVTTGDVGDFCVNGKYEFVIGGKYTKAKEGIYAAADMIEYGEGNVIPLWLFGFLY